MRWFPISFVALLLAAPLHAETIHRVISFNVWGAGGMKETASMKPLPPSKLLGPMSWVCRKPNWTLIPAPRPIASPLASLLRPRLPRRWVGVSMINVL